MFRAAGVSGDEWEVDIRLHGARQFHLRFFRRFLQSLEGHAVGPEIDPLVFLEFIGKVVDNPLVEVLPSEVGIAVGGFHLEDPLTQLQD